MQDFTKLIVWRRLEAADFASRRRIAPAIAHNLTINIYKLTYSMPSEEKFGLISQIRRSCVSIESNLAEGCRRDSDKELARFVDISMGSSFELKILEVNRMLGGFLKKLRAAPRKAWASFSTMRGIRLALMA